jgi:hypothetical protein
MTATRIVAPFPNEVRPDDRMSSQISSRKQNVSELCFIQYHLKREFYYARNPPASARNNFRNLQHVCLMQWYAWEEWTKKTRLPLIFGKVCSSWRELAWSTPLEFHLAGLLETQIPSWLTSGCFMLPLSICTSHYSGIEIESQVLQS